MSDSQKTVVPKPATVSPRRFKTFGIIACVMGIGAALVGLMGVMSGGVDLVDILLFVGGLLLGLVGLSRLRRARTSQS